MFLLVLGPEIINIVHECTSGLKFSLWLPAVLDLPLYVLTAPPSNRRMRNNVLNDVLVGLDQKLLVRVVVQRMLIPDSLQSSLKNWAVTRWSWSEEISWGIPMTGTTLSRYRSARPSAVRVLLHGPAWHYAFFLSQLLHSLEITTFQTRNAHDPRSLITPLCVSWRPVAIGVI